ncbi:MAG: hypothetical protein JXR91_13000 [Deltaproteobacteria bacterium]|nr:hypothetical protein [Deltaproteobacteria bacterium]
MKYRLQGLRLRYNRDNPENIKKRVQQILKIDESEILSVEITSRSIDARKKPASIVYTMEIELSDDCIVNGLEKISSYNKPKLTDFKKGTKPLNNRVVIAGAGPAGLFAGYLLAKNGYAPIIVERGGEIEQRHKAIKDFLLSRVPDPDNNALFGIGGAGTYSDGKLTTSVKHPLIRFILNTLVECGAPENILIDAKPHIGTDVLSGVVNNLKDAIIKYGGELRTNERVDSVVVKNGTLCGIKTSCNNIDTDVLIAATGHSARDTIEMFVKNGVAVEPKPFQMGFRIEHPQSWLDRQQYGDGAGHPALGAATYKLTSRVGGVPVFSFCMCPGGSTIPTVNEAGHLCVNGMSMHARDGMFSSSGIVVTVAPENYGAKNYKDAIDFVRSVEKKAFIKGGGDYTAPAQRFISFLKDKKDNSLPASSYKPGVAAADLREILPPFVSDSIKKAASGFNRSLPGFVHEDAVAIAPEARASSPVRIVRDKDTRESSVNGLYPAGEGSGYAGGIMSAALDGLNTAIIIMEKYAPF